LFNLSFGTAESEQPEVKPEPKVRITFDGLATSGGPTSRTLVRLGTNREADRLANQGMAGSKFAGSRQERRIYVPPSVKKTGQCVKGNCLLL